MPFSWCGAEFVDIAGAYIASPGPQHPSSLNKCLAGLPSELQSSPSAAYRAACKTACGNAYKPKQAAYRAAYRTT